MGLVSSGFAKASLADSWAQLGKGPKLRHLFGKYGNQDCWAVLRRYKQIEDGNGYIGYDEFQQLVGMEEFSLLFIWDLFSQQNELMEVRELLVVICLFSSARLEEKAAFLLALFDKSQCSVSTGLEIAQLTIAILSVFGRCTGTAAPRMKEASAQLKEELPGLLPSYAEAVQLAGRDNAFKHERVVHHNEVELLMRPVKNAYERLPVARPPPQDSPPPPPPDWGLTVGAAQPSRPRAQGAGAGAAGPTARERELLNKGPQEAEPHLAWMKRLEEEPPSPSGWATGAGGGKPAHSWLLMHGVNFASIAKDLPAFRQMFVKAVSTSMGLTSSRLEIVNVTLGTMGISTLVEFLLHPAAGGGGHDQRSFSTLVLLLEQQIKSHHSNLRKGPLGAYIEDAEVLAGQPQRCATPALPRGEVKTSEICTQTDDGDVERLRGLKVDKSEPAAVEAAASLRKAFREVDLLRRKTAKAEANQVSAAEKLRARQAFLAELQQQEEEQLQQLE